MELIAFYIFSVIVTVSAVAVIVARNPVHSVLWLILSFFTAAGMLVLIGAEFLAMLLVVVYVGAVAVLFLFVVMMLDVDFVELKQGSLKYWPFAVLVGIAFIAEITLAGLSREMGQNELFNPMPGAATNAEAIGAVLYTQYFLLFQLAGIILLIAMIGAIVLTLRYRPDIQRQDIAGQTARRRADATEAVSVEPNKGI
ncbi:MAG: NADH:ubiquinone oxidoreductase subunit J [Hyphomonadaceae bacterium]|nr:NADH:ubiquinone oxidoreductase subunit J [Hyphomonadaceae bacterium]OUX93359.1 MAG: NADH:ubiquinone oxidoreductase subunit J [Hyphomonas sp. TMED17]